MMKVRIHGKQGQGTRTAARIIARAGLLQGNYSRADFTIKQDTIIASARIDNKPIDENDYITDADYILVSDDSLLGEKETLKSDKKSTAIINSSKKQRKSLTQKRIIVNVTKLVDDEFNKPLYYIPLLAIMAKDADMPEKILKDAILEELGDEKAHLFGKNLKIIDAILKNQHI